MVNENVEEVVISLDDDLEFTRRLKRRIIDNSFDANGSLKDSDDPKSREFVLRVLDSLDKSALGRKRIQVEEGANEIARETNGFLAQIHRNAVPDPFRVGTPVPRDIAPDIQPSASATSVMISTAPEAGKTNYEDFTKEFLEDHPEYDG